jgi:hypothetical protein
MITDTRRVELALPIMVALDVLLNGVAEHDDEYETTRTALKDALAEVLADCTDRKHDSLLRRCERLHMEIFAPCMVEGSQVAKTGLVLYHLLRVLTDADYLVIAPGSAFGRALDLLLPSLQHAADEPALNASAEKQARKLLRVLQQRGYYLGLEVAA